MRVLVVGGTGILRPAVDALLAAGREVTVLSRSAARLGVLPAAVGGMVGDLDDPPGLEAALGPVSTSPPGGFDAALVYLPAAAEPPGLADPVDPAGRHDPGTLEDPARPSDPTWLAALRVLRAAVDGPLVVVLTSAVAAPPAPSDPSTVSAGLRRRLSAAGAPAADLRLLLLGWTSPAPPEPAGPARWHTPAEISDAALACLQDGAPRRLGVLRPWSGRPR